MKRRRANSRDQYRSTGWCKILGGAGSVREPVNTNAIGQIRRAERAARMDEILRNQFHGKDRR